MAVSKYQTSPRWSPRMHRQTRDPPSSLPINSNSSGRSANVALRVARSAGVDRLVQAEERVEVGLVATDEEDRGVLACAIVVDIEQEPTEVNWSLAPITAFEGLHCASSTTGPRCPMVGQRWAWEPWLPLGSLPA